MAAADTIDAEENASPSAGQKPSAAAKSGRGKLLIIGGVVVLVLSGMGAAYATGIMDKLTGSKDVHSIEVSTPGAIDLPEIVANLNAGPRRTAFVKLKARLELGSKADEAIVQAAMPRLQDLFQTYLRDMRPEELRGSAGGYRLREELIARANIAAAPARVTAILFIEMLVQ